MNNRVPTVTLDDLPTPPAGKSGWPWTESTPMDAYPLLGGSEWPSITVITPSYNQGRYLEETIRSVLLQGYPNLEYFIIDGGSTDDSVEIIRKYEKWLAGWVSEKDGGQSDALNKGFQRSRGEIINWLCSDDLLAMGALQAIGSLFAVNPQTDVVAGACALQYDQEPWKSSVRQAGRTEWSLAPYAGVIWQPSCFFRRSLIRRRELVMPELHYCMDRELWTYLWSKNAKWEWTNDVYSVFRFTDVNKSSVGGLGIIKEIELIYSLYFKEVVPLPWLLRRIWLPFVRLYSRHQNNVIHHGSRIMSRVVTMILVALYQKASVRALQRDFHHYGRN